VHTPSSRCHYGGTAAAGGPTDSSILLPLQVIRARLHVRDAHEAELLEDRERLLALKREHTALAANRDHMRDELDAVRTLLPPC
jgi:hypothetical protein